MLSVTSLENFNWIEGSFWFLLSLICIALFLKVNRSYRSLAMFAFVVLFTFGLSDFLEAVYGSFLVAGMEWLYIWKIIDVIGLCVVVVWYLKLRLEGKKLQHRPIWT